MHIMLEKKINPRTLTKGPNRASMSTITRSIRKIDELQKILKKHKYMAIDNTIDNNSHLIYYIL
jgi:hypothetical protein